MLVLWVLALLTVMALGLTTAQRTGSMLTANQLDGARFRAAADAMIGMTVLNLLTTPLEYGEAADVLVPDGRARPLRFDGQDLELTLYNEASRIDLNSATREQLVALIELAQGEEGFDPTQRDALADAILDWRDEDDLTMLNGAEDGDYEAAGYPYGARDDRFESVQELRQVLGMTPALYRRLAPSLSVDTGSGRVDERFASAEVLAAMQGLALDDAQRLVAEREQPVVPDAEVARPADRGGPLYRIRIAQRLAGGAGRAMEALVSVRGGGQPPYEVLWRRFGLLPEESAVSGEVGASQ